MKHSTPSPAGFPASTPGRRRILAGLLALAVASAVTVAGPVAGARERSKEITVEGEPLPVSDEVGTIADPAIGMPAPTLIGQTFKGKREVVFESDGTPRIVVFLAHWCPHCRAEVPRIVALAKAGGLEGVEVQAVVTRTDDRLPNYPPSKWLKREGWPFKPVLVDDRSVTALLAYGGDAFPFFVFVDADGLVAGRSSVELTKAALRTTAENLVAGEPLEGLAPG